MAKMSARQHLKELQLRLMAVAAFFIIGATLAYTYQDQLIPFLLAPVGHEKLIYLNPAGGFSFVFLVSIYAGVALAFPIFIQQLYGFLRPALPKSAQKKSARIIVGSLLLLVSGMAFGYFVAVPNALNFLYNFADKYVDASLTADSYLNFIIAYTIGIGIVFQIPLLLMLFHAVKPLKPGGLLRSERWVILIAFVIAAFITPTPDPVNQTLIAGPVIIVYQIGVFVILWSILKQRRVERRKVKEIARRALPVTPIKPEPVPSLASAITATPTITPEVPTPVAPVLAAKKPAPAPFQDIKRPLHPQPLTQTIAHPSRPAPQRPTTIRTVDGFRSTPRNTAAPLSRSLPTAAHAPIHAPAPAPLETEVVAQPVTPRPARKLNAFGEPFSSDGIIRQRVVSF